MSFGELNLTSGGVTTTYRSNCINTVPTSANICFSSRITAPSSGQNNFIAGSSAGAALTSGNNNVIIGSNAGTALTSGSSNFALGPGALQGNTTGGENVAIGQGCMNLGTGGFSRNVSIGYQSGQNITTTANGQNVSIGYTTGKSITTGSNVTSVGANANTSGNTTLTNSTAIGANSSNANFNSSTAIGSNATNTSASQIRLGTSSETVSCPGAIIVDGRLSTSITTAPFSTRDLGIVYNKNVGWSNITNAATNINTIAIDGATVAFGVYRIEVFVNYTNGAAAQDFRIGVSTVSATLQAPLRVTSTQSSEDDGVIISQTISAYTNTTFYIVAQSSAAAGATLYTTGARNSTILLTRIA
jgi:hypothetical protein